MTVEEIKKNKRWRDIKLAAEMLGMTPSAAQMALGYTKRGNGKRHLEVKSTIEGIISDREKMINKYL